MRTFDTGATRDNDDTKFDYEGFLSPLALYRYAQYMTKHRRQADGSLRASDNWQKGIPVKAYCKSLWRHFFDVWATLRGWSSCVGQSENPEPTSLEDSLCGLIFNASGMLHEVVKARVDTVPEFMGDRPVYFDRLDNVNFGAGPVAETADLVKLVGKITGAITNPSRMLPAPKTCGECSYFPSQCCYNVQECRDRTATDPADSQCFKPREENA